MKKQLINIILLLILFSLIHTGLGFCFQKNQSFLTFMRTEEHENFTRIVFEFQNAIQSKDPKIKDKGKFSIQFLDSTTNLDPLTVYWTDSLQKVQSIKFIKDNPNLTANVTLTFPYFRLKSFSLSDPDRVVIDSYSISALSKDAVSKPSIDAGVPSQISEKLETKKVEKTKLNPVQDRISPGKYTVYLHYSNEKNKKPMKELATFLKNKGFDVNGMERINYKHRDVRYFHDQDKSGALLLKKQFTRFIELYTHFKETNIKIFNLGHKYPNAKKGVLELWVSF
jgi:hypothetical protein